MMLRRATIVFSVLAFATAALGQAAPPQNSLPTAEASNSMDPPKVGDHWTYQLRDEITGTLKSTVVNVITEVSPDDIDIRTETLGTAGYGYLVYDHSWNVKDTSTWKYSPGDGTGVKTPLKVGSNWSFQSSDTYAARGISTKRTGTSKVVAQETVTTAAGTFDTFRIETTATVRSANDPTNQFGLIATTWYAPSVDHWVKRTSKVTVNNHLQQNTTLELVGYGRR
jgi:hypothetical protein